MSLNLIWTNGVQNIWQVKWSLPSSRPKSAHTAPFLIMVMCSNCQCSAHAATTPLTWKLLLLFIQHFKTLHPHWHQPEGAQSTGGWGGGGSEYCHFPLPCCAVSLCGVTGSEPTCQMLTLYIASLHIIIQFRMADCLNFHSSLLEFQ